MGSLARKCVPQFEEIKPESSATNNQAETHAPKKTRERERTTPCPRSQNATALVIMGTHRTMYQRTVHHLRKYTAPDGKSGTAGRSATGISLRDSCIRKCEQGLVEITRRRARNKPIRTDSARAKAKMSHQTPRRALKNPELYLGHN